VSVLGKITVTLSDDPRYAAGQTYDVVLSTPNTPDPSNLLTGTMNEQAPPADPTSTPPGA